MLGNEMIPPKVLLVMQLYIQPKNSSSCVDVSNVYKHIDSNVNPRK